MSDSIVVDLDEEEVNTTEGLLRDERYLDMDTKKMTNGYGESV